MKENKGITLVALIITIIVLLILAVVTISAVNEGSLFAHANNAATSYSKAQEEENTIIANYSGKLNGPTVEPHDIYYNMPYISRGKAPWGNKSVDSVTTIQIDNDNNIRVLNLCDDNVSEGEAFRELDDGYGGYIVTTQGGNIKLKVDSIEYNTEYHGYNSLGLPVTVWFDDDGDLNSEHVIPGEYLNIDTEERTIDIGNGTVTGTYSVDGRTINIVGRTFVIE